MLREWREDYTLLLTSHFSRIHTALVSQNNAYATMCCIGCFEVAVWALMITSMSEIIARPDMEFDINAIDWNRDMCDEYGKRYLRKCFKFSKHLLPLSATLMSLGTFFCCYLCKPPYGLTAGVVLRYPFAITMVVYSWWMYGIYSYFTERDCILPTSTADMYDMTSRIGEIHEFLYRLCIYNTLILTLMTPSLLFVYFFCFYGSKLLKRAALKLTSCCSSRINPPRTSNVEHYSDKSERYGLVEKSVSDCPICMAEQTEIILTKGCLHGCCHECLKQYLKSDLKNIGAYPRKCFMNDCRILLNYTNVEYALTDENELEEYDRMLIMCSTQGNNETMACPLCNAVMLKPRDEADQGLMQCVNESCECDLCSKCGVAYHMNQSCDEYMAELKSKTSGADEEFDELAKRNKWCKCPQCGLVVERTEGCYHMTHHGCPGGGEQRRTDFCYFCGELLTKKEGEGWRFSKKTETRHFENGVYAKCVNAENGNLQRTSDDFSFIAGLE